MRAGRRTLRIHRPEKVLFLDDGLTKAEVIDYYRRVAASMVPQLRDAPWSLRPEPGCPGRPVATPISRGRLDDPGLTAQRWPLRDVAAVLAQAAARPWSEVPARGRSLRTARRRLDALR